MAVLRGRVFDRSSGDGLVGARVVARSRRRVVGATRTGPAGAFQLDVPDGTVDVQAELEGFAPARGRATVRGRDVAVDLALEPVRRPEAPSSGDRPRTGLPGLGGRIPRIPGLPDGPRIPGIPDGPRIPGLPGRPGPPDTPGNPADLPPAPFHSVQVVLRAARVEPEVDVDRSAPVHAEVTISGAGTEALAPTVPVRLRARGSGARSTPLLMYDGVVPSGASLELRLVDAERGETLWDGTLHGPVSSWPGAAMELAGHRIGWTLDLVVAVAREGAVRRPEWGRLQASAEFRARRSDRRGRFHPEWFREGLRHMRRLDPSIREIRDPDLPPSILEAARTTPVCMSREGRELPLGETEPPGPFSAFGAAGRYVHVEMDEGGPGTLLLPLDPSRLAGLDPASLRGFVWDEAYGRFQLLTASGFDAERRVAWARVHRSGTYGVFGLPADRARLDLARMVCRIRGWERLHLAGVDVGGLREDIDRLCQLILCRPELHAALDDPAILEAVGLEDRRVLDLAVRGAPPTDAKGRPQGPAPIEQQEPERPRAGDLCGECLGTVAGEPLPEPHDPLERRRFLGASPLVDCQLIPRFGSQRPPPWYSIGPSNHAGRVKALAWHPARPRAVFAGNSQGGVWYSPDRGRSWYPRMHSQESLAIGDLAIAPSRPDRLYAATGEYFGGGSSGAAGIGVYVSDDGGWAWTLYATANTRCSRVRVDPRDPDVVYLAGAAGLERSLDGGVSWSLLVAGSVDDILLDPVDPDRLYVARDSSDGLQRIDRASTRPDADFMVPGNWTAVNDGLELTRDHKDHPWTNYLRLAAAVEDGRTRLWCQVNSLPEDWPANVDPDWLDYGVTVYRFDGSEWEDRGTPGGVSFGNWCSTLEIEPGNPGVLYSGRSSSWWTPDEGETWLRARVGHADTHAFAFDPADPRHTLVGHDGGIYAGTRPDLGSLDTADGEIDYVDSNDGHRTIQFQRISVSEEGSFGVGGSTQDKGVLVNHGSHLWDAIGGHEWGDIQFASRSGDVVVWDPKWAQDWSVQRSDDGGATRRHFDAGLGQRHAARIALRPGDEHEMVVATLPLGLDRPGAVRLPHGAVDGLTDFTFCAWIRTDARHHWTIVSGANTSDDRAWTAFVDEDGHLNSVVGSDHAHAAADVLRDGDWHHLVWSREGVHTAAWVDGSAVLAVSLPPAASPPRVRIDPGGLVVGQEHLSLGGGYHGKRGFTGAMADVRVYARALSATERDSVRAGGDLGTTSLRGRWPLEGPLDGEATDLSPASRHGSVESLGVIHDAPRGGNAACFPVGREVSPALYRWRDAGLQFGFRFDGFMPVLGAPVLRLPRELLDRRGTYVVSLWVRSDRTGRIPLLSGARSDEDNSLLWHYRGAGDFDVFVDGVSSRISGMSRIDDQALHHLALVRSGTGFEVFVDGASVGSVPGSRVSRIDPDGLVVGQEQDGVGGGFQAADALVGDLRDLVIVHGPLAAAEVQAIFAAGPGGPLPPGVNAKARYPLDGDARDVAGEGWHGATEHVEWAIDVTGATVARFGNSPAAFRDLAYSPADPDQVYAVDEAAGIWHSRDHGFHWEKVADAPATDPAGLTPDWTRRFRLYLSEYGVGHAHAWRSDDGGLTWTNIDGASPDSVPDAPVARIVPSDRASDVLFAAADVGVVRSDDGGLTWYAWDQGLPNAPCTDIALRRANGVLYASTYGRGAWARQI